ncbi:MAG: BamA/TamA family outer membrane protein [Acidobacteria bacterium]|nr:BamA/TamA family outer membrane protein [Acidobacteriota bacterium]
MRCLVVFVALLTWVPGVAVAQQTRAEWLEQQRAERAAQLETYVPNIAEKTLLYIEDHRLLERLSMGFHGIYPRFGGFTTGSGLALGAGYRHTLPGTTLIEMDASAGISTRAYKAVDLRLRAPSMFNGRLELDAGTRWWDYTQEDFFGLGESSRGNRTSYRYEALNLDLRTRVRPRRWFSFGGDVGYLRPTIGSGTDRRFRSTEERFDDAQAPGLDRAPRLLYARSFVDLDYRDHPINTRAGGRLLVEIGGWRAQDRSRAFSFRRTDVSLLHVFPIFDKKRGFAVRVAAGQADPLSDGGRIPFFLAPTIGGSTTIRSYREMRFRDSSYVLINGEYRWEAFSALDLALFWDGGDVAERLQDLRWDEFKTGWGFGLRFNTARAVFLRTDVGFGGREGPRLFIKFGPPF